MVGSHWEADNRVRLARLGRQHENRDARRLRPLAQPLTDLQARKAREHEIEDDEIRLFPLEQAERFLAVLGFDGLQPLLDEVIVYELANVRFVFDDEDFSAGHGWFRPTGESLSCAGCSFP